MPSAPASPPPQPFHVHECRSVTRGNQCSTPRLHARSAEVLLIGKVLQTVLTDMSSSKLGLFELVVPLLDPEEEKRRAEIRAEDRERAREARNAANRRRRIAAKENGICLTCRNTPADPGIALCSKCRKTNQTRIRERYLRRKAAGLCKRCDNTARKDKTDCEECAKKQWEYDQRMRQGKRVAEPEAARQEDLTPRPRQAEIQNSQLKAASKEGDNARNE